MDCLNLMTIFGDRYQVTFDPAYSPRARPRHALDPWMMQIPCRYGVIYPFDETRLCIELRGHGITATKLADLECCKFQQQGDRERSFLFWADSFEEVATVVRPRKRRRLSEEHRRKLQASNTPYRYQPRYSRQSSDALRLSEISG